MFTDIFHIIMLEASETAGMKQDENNHDFRVAHTVRFVTMLAVLIFKHIFFLLQCKFLAKIICQTINLYNFSLWEHSGDRLNVIFGTIKLTLLSLYSYYSSRYLLGYIELTLPYLIWDVAYCQTVGTMSGTTRTWNCEHTDKTDWSNWNKTSFKT